MRGQSVLLMAALVTLLGACTTVPVGTYFADPRHTTTQKVSDSLHRAALAAGDDPARYSFALVRAEEAQVYRDADATFYVTDGLARLPNRVVDALLAHAVAHEVLEHMDKRRALSLSMSAGFAVAGIMVPGAGLADFLVNPLVVRAVSRDQVLKADAKTVEILRAMGYEAPRRTLASALQTVEAINARKMSTGGLLDTLPPLGDRLAALEPLEPLSSPLAEAQSGSGSGR